MFPMIRENKKNYIAELFKQNLYEKISDDDDDRSFSISYWFKYVL